MIFLENSQLSESVFFTRVKIEVLQVVFIKWVFIKLEPNRRAPPATYIFFSVWVFLHDLLQITGLQGKGEGISLIPHYHLHPLHRHLDINRAITAESSPLHIASSWVQTGNL